MMVQLVPEAVETCDNQLRSCVACQWTYSASERSLLRHTVIPVTQLIHVQWVFTTNML